MPAVEGDRLRYAFRKDGWLDPGTKLLELGLDGYTPIQALKTLQNNPVNMSVALHEITHFVSLENTLGHLLGFRAMRANSVSDGLLAFCRKGEAVDPATIVNYCNMHRRYRLLMEAWRPLLEGLAVYVQLHRPNEEGGALVEPLSVLSFWKANITVLSGLPARAGLLDLLLSQIDEGFLAAGYRAIREGPSLMHGDQPLAACFELLKPQALLPYFLGHAYLRALQRYLAHANPDYESAENFIALMMRLLRSSTRRLLSGEPQWDQPSGAERIYNWIEIIRHAKPEWIVALSKQDDNVDVLQFLETGESTLGYGGMDTEVVRDLSQIVPKEWEEFAGQVSARHFDDIAAESGDPPIAGSNQDRADRIARAWIRGTASLNLSAAGPAAAAGWIPDGFQPKHALAIKVDGQLWWAALTDNEIGRLIDAPAQLPKLDRVAMRRGDGGSSIAASCGIFIDCFAIYAPWTLEPGGTGQAPILFPTFRFYLYAKKPKNDSVLTMIASAPPGSGVGYLNSIDDQNEQGLHKASLEMRRIVSKAHSPRGLAMQFEKFGKTEIATILTEGASRVELAESRVKEHANRRILRGLMGRLMTADDIALLSKGIGVFPEAADLAAFIAAAYGREAVPDSSTAERIGALNKHSREVIGKLLFVWDATGRKASYCGLWGDNRAPMDALN
jgi:hypothetical protein